MPTLTRTQLTISMISHRMLIHRIFQYPPASIKLPICWESSNMAKLLTTNIPKSKKAKHSRGIQMSRNASIRYQSLWTGSFLFIHTHINRKYILIAGNGTLRAERVICMPHLIHSSNTMIFSIQFLILQFSSRESRGWWIANKKLNFISKKQKNEENTIKTRHYFNYAFFFVVGGKTQWASEMLLFLMAFNYTLLICVFRISNFSNCCLQLAV